MRRLLLAALLLSACEKIDEAKVEPATDMSVLGGFDTTVVSVLTAADTIDIRAEVAATDAQRQLGLMERTQLSDSAGMIFIYEEVQDTFGGFWMYRTRIPLDIAFIDTTNTIVTIRAMQPCESPNAQLCPTYAPSAPYQKALEVNLGWFERHGVKVGDRVLVR